MAGDEVWVVPGAPLPAGGGWRIWYSRGGTDDFVPAPITVLRRDQPEAFTLQWSPLDPYPGLKRRMGVLEVRLAQTAPGDTYDLIIPETPARRYRWKSMPDSIVEGAAFVLASCFWLPDDKDGNYAAGLRQLTKIEQPAFKLLIGDQVYQDWPPNLKPLHDAVGRYQRRYDQYWGHPAYQEVLTASPNFFTGDDHEFWNGFPERAFQVPFTLTERGRQDNARAARALFHYYQTVNNPTGRAWFDFSVGPVSFFVSDSRSERTHFKIDDPHFFSEEQWQALEGWARRLTGPGVLVLGQPLFGKKGDWKEPALRDYEGDFVRLCGVFETALAGGGEDGLPHDILILTGDIHRARHFTATLAGMPGTGEVHELVSSAASQIGPAIKSPHIDDDALKFTVARDAASGPRTWDARPVALIPDLMPSADNNLAVIRMTPGTRSADTGQPRVRFTLAIWSLRPFAKVWSRLLHRARPKSLSRLYEKELELR
ncbi:MAG: alkaline phosphatase D family protein [Acidimicrobiales bacterium]